MSGVTIDRLPPRRAFPWLTCGLVATAVVAWLLPGHGAALGWTPDAAPWRLLTSQLAHWDGNHLLWDALAVLILGCWAERSWPIAARLATAIALILIPAVVVLVHGGIAFRGLSGLAFTLAAVAAIGTWRSSLRDDDLPSATVAGALVVGMLAKLAFEALTGRTVFASAAGWQPVPIAHAIGLFAGWIACLRPTPHHPPIATVS